MAPEVAVIPVSPHELVHIWPAVVVFTRPVVLTVATAVAVEPHVTEFVRSWMLPLVNVPIAVNCLVTFLTMNGWAGITVIELRVGAITVRIVEPLTAPEAA